MLSFFRTVQPALSGSHNRPIVLREDDVEHRIASLCQLPAPDARGVRPKISDEQVLHISIFVKYLDQIRHRPNRHWWSMIPRIYIILRAIDALPSMDNFVLHEFTDITLPFSHQTLPEFVQGETTRAAFLEAQGCVLLEDVRALELHRAHISLPRGGDEHFVSLARLGSGGYGTVDAVYSKLSLRHYARKRMARSRDSDHARHRQSIIVGEITSLKKLSHRHLVEIIGSYTDAECIAYLMQPLADCNLYQFLEGEGRGRGQLKLTEKIALRSFFGCLAGAVDYLHSLHIRHRDLKPQNVLVKGTDVYLGDFGAAMDWSGAKQSVTQDRNTAVTYEYMAPEAAHGPKGSPSDMWSLGLIFLDMVTVLTGSKLSKWRSHLQKKAATARKAPYAFQNMTSVQEWLNKLQSGDHILAQDNEPLIWIKELLREKPDQRLTSKLLVRSITDSSYSNDFCCYTCRQCFLSESYFTDTSAQPEREVSMRESQLKVNQFVALTSIPRPERTISIERASSINAWRHGLVEQGPHRSQKDHHLPQHAPGAWFGPVEESPPDSERQSEGSLIGDQQADVDQSNVGEFDLFVQAGNDDSSEDSAGSTGAVEAEKRFDGDLFQAIEAPSSDESDRLSVDSGVRVDSVLLDCILEENGEDQRSTLAEGQGTVGPQDKSHPRNNSLRRTGVDERKAPPSHPERLISAVTTTDPTIKAIPPASPKKISESAKDDFSGNVKVLDIAPSIPHGSQALSWKGVSLELPGVLDPLGSVTKVPTMSKDKLHASPATSAAALDGTETMDKGLYVPTASTAVSPRTAKSDSADEVRPGKRTQHVSPEASIQDTKQLSTPPAPATTSASAKGIRAGEGDMTRNVRESASHNTDEAHPTRASSYETDTPSLWIPGPQTSSRTGSSKPPPVASKFALTGHGLWDVRKKTSSSTRTFSPGQGVPSPPPLAESGSTKRDRSASDAPANESKLSAANLDRLHRQTNTSSQPISEDDRPSTESKTKTTSAKSPKAHQTENLFDPGSYIEWAWHEMEQAESIATSIMSDNTRKLINSSNLSTYTAKSYDVLEHLCRDGKVKGVREWLGKRGCNPGTAQNPRPKPLLLAIKGASDKHNKCVKALISRGCDVNANSRKKTPIHWAIERPYFGGYTKLLALLLSAGAQMDTPDGVGDYPLLKLFAGATSDPLEDYKTEALALILNPNLPTTVDVNVRQAISLNTALHLAIQRRAPIAVALLMHCGANVNAKNASGTTLLLMAANQWRGLLSAEQRLILQYLLNSGSIKVDVTGGSLARTALHNAVVSGSPVATRMLLERGADPYIIDKENMDASGLLRKSVKQSITPAEAAVREEITALLQT